MNQSQESPLHVVFGANGGAGNAVARALAHAGHRVRAVSRSGKADLPPVIAQQAGDAGDAASVRAACEGATVIYHCVNVPYAEWPARLPVFMTNLIEGAAAVGARLVYCDNLYMYGPVDEPMTEFTPPKAITRKGSLRAALGNRLLGAHATGKVDALIVRASDFFGPRAPNTLPGMLVFPKVEKGSRAYWLGSLDAPHALNYIEDVGRQVAVLGNDAKAYGQIWHLPPAGAPTGRAFIEAAFEAAKKPVKAGYYGRGMMRLAGLFDRQLRELGELMYQFEKPFYLDGSKFLAAYPDQEPTPMIEAIKRTVEWEATRRKDR